MESVPELMRREIISNPFVPLGGRLFSLTWKTYTPWILSSDEFVVALKKKKSGVLWISVSQSTAEVKNLGSMKLWVGFLLFCPTKPLPRFHKGFSLSPDTQCQHVNQDHCLRVFKTGKKKIFGLKSFFWLETFLVCQQQTRAKAINSEREICWQPLQ